MSRSQWKREQAKQKREARKKRVEYVGHARTAMKAIAKLLCSMKETHRWQEDRKNIVRKALDVLAGEVAS